MKIKSVESILKSAKQIIVYRNDRYGQWLGDESSMYPMFNLPNMTEKNIFALFDIPEDKQSKYHFQERSFPERLDLRDYACNERLIQRGKLTLFAFGRELEPLDTSIGTLFIDRKYLKPFADEKEGFELYERRDTLDNVHIVAKSGMLIIGIIVPFNLANKHFLYELEALTDGVRRAGIIKETSDIQQCMEN